MPAATAPRNLRGGNWDHELEIGTGFGYGKRCETSLRRCVQEGECSFGKQKAASIQVKKIANEQLMESVEVKQMLTLRPTLLKGFGKLERELKKC